MKELKSLLLVSLLALPIAWTASLGRSHSASGLDQALASLLLGALPLLGSLLFWQEDFCPTNGLIRFGADRRKIAFVQLVRSITVMSILAVGGSITTILSLSESSGQALWHDLMTTTAVAWAGALSVTCFFALGRAWAGKWGLGLLLIFSWVLGPTELLASALLPAGHIRYLLGVGEGLPFAPWLSLLALYAIATVSGLLLMLRVPR